MCALLLSGQAEGAYPMFELASIDGKSARLRGPLFLEAGEELTLRIDTGDGDLDVRARVQAVSCDDKTMSVELLDLTDDTREKLGRL